MKAQYRLVSGLLSRWKGDKRTGYRLDNAPGDIVPELTKEEIKALGKRLERVDEEEDDNPTPATTLIDPHAAALAAHAAEVAAQEAAQAPGPRHATARETAGILRAEGVEVGDILGLPDGRKVRVLGLDEALVIEFVEEEAPTVGLVEVNPKPTGAPAVGAYGALLELSVPKVQEGAAEFDEAQLRVLAAEEALGQGRKGIFDFVAARIAKLAEPDGGAA